MSHLSYVGGLQCEPGFEMYSDWMIILDDFSFLDCEHHDGLAIYPFCREISMAVRDRKERRIFAT